MSEEDRWSRWFRRKRLPFFTRWHFSDLNDLFREMEEMMEREFRELSRKVPKDLVRERTLHAFRARIHKIED